MADQSRNSRFRAQFESALQAYQRKTNITLAEHSIAIQFQGCHSVEPITTFLQNEARAFNDLPRSEIIMKSIESIVSILSAISATLEAFSLVRQNHRLFHVPDWFFQPLSPTNAIYAGLAVLLDVCVILPFLSRYPDVQVNQAAKGVISSFDALVNFLESMEHFLKRLDIYTWIPATLTMDEIVVKILVELLTTLALATRELKQGRSRESRYR
jgi:hypothetical protein